MIKYKIATKYSKALFELAKEKNVVEKVLKSLAVATEILRTSKDFRIVMIGAGISTTEKKNIIDLLSEKYSIDHITKNFLKLSVDRGKLKFLPYIYEMYQKRYREFIGVMSADIISAIKLDKKLIKSITEGLSKKTNKKLEVKEVVEPEIIGGIIIKTEGMKYDASLKLQLNKIKENILKG